MRAYGRAANIASWAQGQIDNSLATAGTNAATVGFDKLAGNGVIYDGMAILGSGAVLAGLLLGAIAVFVIDKQYSRAIVFSLIGAVLAAVGLIHDPVGLIWDPSTGIVRLPNTVWIGYVFGAIVIAVVAWREGALSSMTMRDAVMTPPPAEAEPV